MENKQNIIIKSKEDAKEMLLDLDKQKSDYNNVSYTEKSIDWRWGSYWKVGYGNFSGIERKDDDTYILYERINHANQEPYEVELKGAIEIIYKNRKYINYQTKQRLEEERERYC